MPDLQNLLDQIDRLDQEATKGPWWGVMDDLTDVVQIFHDQEQRLHVADIGDKTLERVWQDAEFIALSRTALPQLAKALRAVTELHLRELGGTPTGDPADYCPRCMDYWPCDPAQELIKTITDAMGADDDTQTM